MGGMIYAKEEAVMFAFEMLSAKHCPSRRLTRNGAACEATTTEKAYQQFLLGWRAAEGVIQTECDTDVFEAIYDEVAEEKNQ
jgi:hypothetical protein